MDTSANEVCEMARNTLAKHVNFIGVTFVVLFKGMSV